MLNFLRNTLFSIKSFFSPSVEDELLLISLLKEFVIAKELYENVDTNDSLCIRNCYTYVSHLKLNIIEELFSTISKSNKTHFNAMIRELGDMQDVMLRYNANLEFSDYDEVGRMNEYIRKYKNIQRREMNEGYTIC